MGQGSGSRESAQGVASHQGRVKPDPGGDSQEQSLSPFIIAKILICKLFQKGPLHHPFGCFILEEVDKHVLQSRIAVRGGGLSSKLVEPGVFFVECL